MKKMITFILGAAMAISLVGCGGNNGSGKDRLRPERTG